MTPGTVEGAGRGGKLFGAGVIPGGAASPPSWVFFVLVLSTPLLASGCVQVADCNESVPCSDGKVCYRYECRRPCGEDGECEASGAVCRPCVDPVTGENDCFGRQGDVCVPEE